MIEFKQGNILNTDTEALVNTVNCVGVMGKGIALQFKENFPENFREYKQACSANQIRLGHMFIVNVSTLFKPYPKYIINFPTKQHWREKSNLDYIGKGLEALIADIKQLQIESIAVPALGCGNGGLNWLDVRPLILEAFSQAPNVRAEIFEPTTILSQNRLSDKLDSPVMTPGRGLLILLLSLYVESRSSVNALEIQKLAYFLQASGEQLKLRYDKYFYGPYADNLRHVLRRIEGYYISGYTEENIDSQIRLLPGALEKARQTLTAQPLSLESVNRVNYLIKDYKSPYWMELLATIHWIVEHSLEASNDPMVAVSKVEEWSDRKRNLFSREDIIRAWHHLNNEGWIRNNKLLKKL